MEISIFDHIFHNEGGGVTSIPEFLNNVKYGKWDQVARKIASISDKERRSEEKKNLVPYVTVSGKFSRRKKENLIKHSGFICLDFDDVEDIELAISQIKNDPYCYAVFKSISGRGLSMIAKIDPKRHLDAFLGFEKYFATKYELYIDRACKDVTRARFVSSDPDLFTNEDSDLFKEYIPKSAAVPKKKLPNVITGVNDMDFIMKQINDTGIDITKSEYQTWLNIGFAIADEFGEAGRSYFHTVSYQSDKYDQRRCDRQYNHCLKPGGVSFPTFLYYVREAGLQIVSDDTRHIVSVAVMTKKSKRGVGEAIKVLKEVDDYSEELTKPIIEKVFLRHEVSSSNKLSLIEQIEIFLNSNYDIRRNEITRFLYEGKEEFDSRSINSIYIRAKKEIDDKISFQDIERMINSDFVEDHNPLMEFFDRYSHENPTGLIDKLSSAIHTRGECEYKDILFKKWIVGIIASIYGNHCPLVYVLTGGQNNGKTQFFRRLLPEEIEEYYAESNLDAGKDDEILMTQKIVIMDDEFGGKSKAEAKKLKELTSKNYFTLREPYGRKNIRLRRLAVLAGTCNEDNILNDPTGNRRIVPVPVDFIDYELCNSINKRDLFIEAYNLYKSGFNWETDSEDVRMLNENTMMFEQSIPERELLIRYFKLPENSDNSDNGIERLQVMEIKTHIESMTNQRLNVHKLTQEIKRAGFKEEKYDLNGNNSKGFAVIKVIEKNVETENFDQKIIKLNAGM